MIQAALRRYWGYDSFLPLQESIVRSLLEGQDTCVVMPTGGGKSLCYQLPAAMLSQQTVIVISPLIALMQDQVAQLTQMGIALLEQTEDQQSVVMRRACEGEYRLLYLSPERLAREDTIGWLQLSFFAIDEAHCISEWGHEFRPEYRMLSCLRLHFPDRPIVLLPAPPGGCATTLSRRDPHNASPASTGPTCPRNAMGARSRACAGKHSGSNVIVYAPTIARVEETVDFLGEQGIPAIATARWTPVPGGATRSAGHRTKCGCWSVRSLSGWGSTRLPYAP